MSSAGSRLLSALALAAVMIAMWLPATAQSQDRFFDSNGVQIRYLEQGAGEPVVLLNGFTSNIEDSWIDTGVFANLARDHHVIAMDSRGHGKSGKPRDPSAYGDEMARDVVRLLDHLRLPRAHIVGYSYSGRMTLKLLTTNPDRFLTAILEGSSGERNWTDANLATNETSAVELERDGSFRTLFLATAPTDEPKPGDEAIRQHSAQLLLRNDRFALAASYRARRGLAVTNEQIAMIRVPTLAVVGSADGQLPGVKALQGAMPSLKLIVLEGGTHEAADPRSTQRRPEFVAAIREFIAASQKAK